MATKCTGRRSNGERCGAWAVRGTTVCVAHGGAAPQVRAKAAARLAEEKATRELGRLAAVAGPAEPVSDPLTALSQLAGQVLRWKDLLADHVAELEALRYSGEHGEQIRGEIQVFERAMDRCASVLTAMARLKIDDRLARVSEQQAAMVADALAAVMGEMGLSHDQQREARTRVAGHLRVVAG